MVQREKQNLCAHPTWFILNSDFIVNVFDKMKLFIRCLYIRFS